jgi:hypothetical protein
MADVNDRAKELRAFFTFMLGTTETAPLVVGETPVNGATINALLDCFKCCYPEAKPERVPPPRTTMNDPLGLLPTQ